MNRCSSLRVLRGVAPNGEAIRMIAELSARSLTPVTVLGPKGAALDVARGLAAAGVLVSAAVHLDLWDLEGFRRIHIIGPLFLLNVIAGLLIGVLVVSWRHWLPALAAVAFGAATLTAFWLSVKVGLFGFRESATGSAQVLAEGAEIAAIAFGIVAVSMSWLWRTPSGQGAREPATVRSRDDG
jgi:hypothetical protein